MEQNNDGQKFVLSKIKLLPGGGVRADYQTSIVIGEEVSVRDYTVCSDNIAHPDLTGLFDELRPIVLKTFGLGALMDMGKEGGELYGDLLGRLNVHGLSWSGNGDTSGIVVSAVFETVNGSKSALNTPHIKFARASYGFEEELEAITNEIKDEAYKYLFEGKQAQLSLFGEEPKEAEGLYAE